MNALRTDLPPGPRFGIVQSLGYMRDPYAIYADRIARYGDPVRIPTINGPLVVTADPEGVKQIFAADPDTFEVWTPDLLAPMVGSNSLLLVSGARHRRDRKLLTPPFHGARMRAYGESMRGSTLRVAGRFREGEPFLAQTCTQALSLDIIIRTVFGVVEPHKVDALRMAIVGVAETAHPTILFFRSLRRSLGGYGPWDAFVRARDSLDRIMFAEIRERRQSGHSGEDILSMMLAARYEDGGAMSDDELRDELLTLLLAGHETTAIALAWSLYWLHRHPDTLAKVHAELDALPPDAAPDALAQLPYLDAVCSETLRLHPIVPDIARRLRRPFELKGYLLPAGESVGVAITALHNRTDLYPEPTRFRPERFIERRFSPFEWAPFGGGARRCLGAAFAQFEMKIVLGTLLRAYRFRLDEPGDVKPARRSITMGPATGVRLVYEGLRVRANSPRRANHDVATPASV